MHVTVLGMDPETDYIAIHDSWWADAIVGKLGMSKFKDGPLPHEDLTELVFINATSTSEYVFVSGVNTLDSDSKDLPASLLQDANNPATPLHTFNSGETLGSSQGKRPRPVPTYPSSSRPEKHINHDAQLKRLVDIYESMQTPFNRLSGVSATSPMHDSTREEFMRLMKLVDDAGAAEGSDEYHYASQLFMKLELCTIFLSMAMSHLPLHGNERGVDLTGLSGHGRG